MKKIALIGSAPSSIRLAPYKEPSWAIWGCSPGAYGVVGMERIWQPGDAWWELHRWEPQVAGKPGTGKTWFSPEYVEMMARYPGTVWMSDLPPEIPNAMVFPLALMMEKYGPFFFTSSLSYMFAMALEEPDIEEIGLWGVDMSATEEYGYQRAGCQYFITEAIKRGIRVTIPPESDLLQPPFMYGVAENNPMVIKLTARREELTNRLRNAEATHANSQQEIMFLKGALDDLDYMFKTWTTWQGFILPTMGKTGNEVRAATAE
jgi:hypothetical protein